MIGGERAAHYYDGKPITSLAEYERAVQLRREFDEQKPYAAVFLLSDSTLLFWKEEGIDWIHRVRCELPTRALTYDGYEAEVKASYIGAANGDTPEHYETFCAAMATIGVECCAHVHAQPSPAERAHLEQSDIVLVAGGDIERGLRALINIDGSPTYLGESVRWRYYDGAVIVGIAEGATLLGQKCWTELPPEQRTEQEQRSFFKALGIVPSIVVPNGGDDEVTHAIARQLGPGTIQLGIPRGGGCIFNTDNSFEPVRCIMSDVHYDYQRGDPHTNLVAPPEKGEGIIVAVERFKAREKRAKELRAAEEEARKAAGIAAEEEAGEGDGEGEDDAQPVTDVFRAKAAQLKEMGNEAFRKGNTELALSLYREAQLADREDPKICLNIAACLLRQGGEQGLRDCVATCGHALRLSAGKSAKAWWRRGVALRRLGQHLQGYCDLQEALVLEPGDKEVLKEVAAAEAEMADKEPFDAAALDAALAEARSSAGRELDLSGRQLGPRAVRHLAEALAGDDSVITLRLAGNWMRAQGAEHLGRCLHGNGTLSELDLSENALRDRGVRDLIRGGLLQNCQLAVLRLAYNGIQDGVVESLAENLRDCGTLRELGLGGNELGFRSAVHLATLLRAHDGLEVLDLSGQRAPGLGDDAVWRLLSAVAQHKSMRQLDLRGRQLSRESAARLDQKMRHAQCLVRTGRLPPDQRPPPY